MPTPTKEAKKTVTPVSPDFFQRLWMESWTYIKTVVDVVREPILILDKDLQVLAANDPFYRVFRVDPDHTIGQVVYELGNGQWNIPALRKLLEDILPTNTFFKGFEVTHDFPSIGRKVMILNARQIFFNQDTAPHVASPIILLAMEDVTEMMLVAETLAGHANQLEVKLSERTHKLEVQIKKLEQEIHELKSKV